MKKLAAIPILLLAFVLHGYGQQATAKGTVIDTSEKRNLSHAVVA